MLSYRPPLSLASRYQLHGLLQLQHILFEPSFSMSEDYIWRFIVAGCAVDDKRVRAVLQMQVTPNDLCVRKDTSSLL